MFSDGWVSSAVVSFVVLSSMCQQNGKSPFVAVKCERILD